MRHPSLVVVLSAILLSGLNAHAASPASLSCGMQADAKMLGEGGFTSDTFRLTKSADGTYALRFSGQMIKMFGRDKIAIPEFVLADRLNCVFAGPKEQLLHCEELQHLPKDPNINGPTGDMHHLLTVEEETSRKFQDGKIQTETTRTMRYSRGQSMWVSVIELHGKYLPGSESLGDGKDDPTYESQDGTLSIEQIDSNCFTY